MSYALRVVELGLNIAVMQFVVSISKAKGKR
jgi:hypothetical protein